jgi:hypothetical protein
MSTIEQLFQQAQLAEAAYADLSEPAKAKEALQDKRRLSPSKATRSGKAA